MKRDDDKDPSLFDLPGWATTRTDDPSSSYEAADAVAPKVSRLHQLILDILDRNGRRGATPYELIEETGVIYNTIWRRLSELKKMGKVVNNDRYRPNDRGFNETVVTLLRYADPAAVPFD